MRKANWKKGMSIVLTSALVCGTTGITAFAQEETPVSALTGGAAVKAKEWNLVKEPQPVELSDKDKEQLSKEETVYVIANADGSPQKLIVSDWLKNAAGMREISDTTELTDVSDVKGNLSFQKTSGNLGVWDSDGNDIYYQGSIQKALPVDMKVTYRLDGKNISPEELAGKSGKVTIRFDYDNRQKEKVKVGEKEEELYVPFVILTSLILDNDNFHNIEVSNGKIINDGERTIVMGYAMPGLKENLDIQSEDFDIDELELSDYVELTADATDFELATTLTVATNEIFGDMDVDMQDKMDDLSDDMDELQDAMQQLMDGTSDLYDGVLELYDGTDELYDGMGELDDGAKELYDGTGSLKSGAGELVAGVNSLVTGLDTLNSKSSELMAGATQVYQALLAQANQVMGADPTIAVALNQVITGKVQAGVLTQEEARYLQTQMAGGLTIDNCGKVTNLLLKALGGTTRAALPSLQKEALALPVQESDAKLFETPDMVEETPNDEGKDSEETEESPAEKDSEDVKSEEEGAEDEAVSTEDGDGTEEEGKATEEQMAEKEMLVQDEGMVHADVQAKEVIPVQADAGEPAAQADFSGLAAQLKALAGYDSFYQGLKAYTSGVAQADQGAKALLEGAKKLSKGAGDLRDGAKKLKDGTQELKDGGQELKDGVVELRDGSLELKDGTVEFNDEGIQKLVDLMDGDLQELNDRFEATKEAAKAYKSFAGISDEMQGKVKFIYKTAAVEK